MSTLHYTTLHSHPEYRYQLVTLTLITTNNSLKNSLKNKNRQHAQSTQNICK